MQRTAICTICTRVILILRGLVQQFTKMPFLVFWQLIPLSLAVTYSLVWIIYARRFHPLAKYPGPFFASITRWWLIIDVTRGSADYTQKRLHAIYGEFLEGVSVAMK